MATGWRGRVLRVDLTTGSVEKAPLEEDVARTYLGGGALGTYFLLRETSGETDALDPANVVTIAPGVTTGARVSGASRCCVTALSPLTGAVGDGQAGGAIGPAIKRAGYDAIVVTGRAAKPTWLLVDGDDVRLQDAAALTGRTVLQVHDALTAELGADDLSILQCGPAGEKRVRFASLAADLHDVVGRTGMGAALGGKNLRAVAVRGRHDVPFADPETLADLNRRAAARLKDSGFPAILRKWGTPGVVGPQAESGNLATRNYSRSFHPDYRKLDGSSFEPAIGAGATTCFGCVVTCRKKVKADKPYVVTDRLGGPEFETLGMLGSNLEITDPVAVAKANELCNDHGIDTLTMGGLAAYLCECIERGLIDPADVGRKLAFGDADGLLWLIERVVRREGIGDVLAEGFGAAIARFGQATVPYAVHVKGAGLAVHMPQVKPSQALMYAACPIGPDHQSSEHDWLMTCTDDRYGLGIIGSGDRTSTDLDKVRMTLYSQFYYSLLDTLCLCMFCWGPGNLFTYGELVELVDAATGWKTTLWELMKAGERRVTMMRQLNARRGLGREHDKLPPRLFEALPDGPSKGRRVDPEIFARMLEQYYALAGWDPATGRPTPGKLCELGLEWTVETTDEHR